MRTRFGNFANPPAPDIPDIALFGGINRTAIAPLPGRGVLVQINPLTLLEGDQIAVFWQDPNLPAAGEVVPANQNGPLHIQVPANKIEPHTGSIEVWYTIFRPVLGELFTSDKRPVVVDFDIPGDPDPNQATPTINENLLPIKGLDGAVAPGQDLPIGIPRWKFTARGDKLTVSWGSQNLPPVTIADDLGEGGPDIAINVPWALISSPQGNPAYVTYHILDVVSNHSLFAKEVLFDTGVGGRHPAPEILETDDFGNLPIDDLNFGPASVVAEYPGPWPGDVVILSWSGITQEGVALPVTTYSYTWPNPPPIKHTFRVPYDKIVPLVGGEVRTSYTVQPVGAQPPPIPSALCRVAVTGTVVKLARPRVQELVGTELDPDQLTDGATVMVRTDYAFATGADRITMLWRGESADGWTVVTDQQTRRNDESVNDILNFTVAKAKVLQVAGGRVSVSYEVLTPGDVLVPSEALEFTIKRSAANDLPPPSIDGTAADDTLDPRDVGAAIIVRVPPNPALPVADTVFVTWQGFGAGGSFITPPQPANVAGMRFEGDKVVLVPNAGRTVTVYYTLMNNGVPYKNSAIRQIGILEGSAIGDLPAPRVNEAPGGQLDPVLAPAGCTVVLPANADVQPGDSITVAFGTTVLPAGPGPSFSVPAADVARYLGQDITVYYTVTRGASRKESARYPLRVLDLVANDPRVTPPYFREANGTFVLDLNLFAGHATARVDPWPLMASGQVFWLRATSGGLTETLANSEAVLAATPIEKFLVRNWLDALPDRALLTLELKVAFGGGGEATARTYTSLPYTVLARTTQPAFPEPDVPEAAGGTLPGDAPAATLRVPANAPLQAGDTVTGFFAGSQLAQRPATPGVAMDFSIPAALITANRGNIVSCHYSVLRNGATLNSKARPIMVSDPANGWDWEYDFDLDRERFVRPRQIIRFPETGALVMDMQFDPDMNTDPAEQLGVQVPPFPPTGEFRGKCCYVGNPQWVSHNNVFFVNFAENWDVVRFAMTSVDRDVTVSFKDDRLNMISGVITVPGGDPQRQHEVRFDDNGRRRIRHMEIRCKDVIRMDTFKFKR